MKLYLVAIVWLILAIPVIAQDVEEQSPESGAIPPWVSLVRGQENKVAVPLATAVYSFLSGVSLRPYSERVTTVAFRFDIDATSAAQLLAIFAEEDETLRSRLQGMRENHCATTFSSGRAWAAALTSIDQRRDAEFSQLLARMQGRVQPDMWADLLMGADKLRESTTFSVTDYFLFAQEHDYRELQARLCQ